MLRRACALLAAAALGWAGAAFAESPRTVLSVRVNAETGGSFSDDAVHPTVTVTVPPGALSADATLRVRTIPNPRRPGENQVPASAAYRLQLEGGTPLEPLRLARPLKLAVRAAVAPVHPQVGELAVREGPAWQRLASFYRPSSQTVVAFTQRLDAQYQVMHRRLRAEAGPQVTSGRDVFMYETFGNESFFGGVLGLHTLLNNVPPVAAVGLGVQVDINRVPAGIVAVMTGSDAAAKLAALDDPATTRALIKAGAVVGVVGRFDDPALPDHMTAAGITCALCHVTVTPTNFDLGGGPVPLPIGEPRFDGVPNNALDAGAILALTPTAQALGLSNVLNAWGPGRFDVRALDVPGVDRNPLEDGVNNPTTYPPIWNFVDLSRQDYTIGWDGLFKNNGVSNNALASLSEAVYDLIFHGNGAFGIPPFAVEGGSGGGTLPPELSIQPPRDLVAALIQSEAERPGNDVLPPEKLLDMQSFMRSIVSPAPGAFDEAQAEKGFALFHGKANCVACHSTAEFTGPGRHSITEVAPAGGLRDGIKVPGLRGIAKTAPYFHDGSAADLGAVVRRYVQRGQQVPFLDAEEQAQLVEYLKSL
jgi:mono/diheme cytochrome c family protein